MSGSYGEGIVQFAGLHAKLDTPRYLVQLPAPVGKNNGVIGGHSYVDGPPLPDLTGILIIPEKVSKPGQAVVTVGAAPGSKPVGPPFLMFYRRLSLSRLGSCSCSPLSDLLRWGINSY